MTRRVQRDIPDDQVNFVVASMQANGAQVTKTKQSDGLWTVTGVFPDRSGGAATIADRAAEPLISPARPSASATAQPAVGERARAIDTLARTLWGEARGEPRLGKEAVAAVVLNRVQRGRPERFGATIEEVCRKPQQFSCWNPGDPNRELLERVDQTDEPFRECIEIAERAVSGALPDPTNGSDHYHRDEVFPDWSRGRLPVKTIGRHRFFNDIA
jgi:N-acetylmuramoyl-L-alanine amidase